MVAAATAAWMVRAVNVSTGIVEIKLMERIPAEPVMMVLEISSVILQK